MKLTIQIISDNIHSWIIPYVRDLEIQLKERGHIVTLIHKSSEISNSDILMILGCEKIIKPELLAKSKLPIVVHESNLPEGKGWSPLTWQILEGKNIIPICLIKAEQEVDSGDILLRDEIKFIGNELNEEMKHVQGIKTLELCLKLVDNISKLKPMKQSGQSTYYSKRTPVDSKLDINKSILDQINLLRVCDNERYPAYFEYMGKKFKLKIESYE